MIFQNEKFQILLILIPLLIVAFLLFQLKRKRDLARLSNKVDIDSITDRNKYSVPLKFILFIFMVSLSIFAIMRPKWGSEGVSITKKGFEVVFMLDVSPSMLAVDVKPNRLTQAKSIISSMIEKLKGNRFALVTFSGKPTVDPPLTDDIYTFKNFYLETAGVEQIPVKGTIYEDAIDLSSEMFSNNPDLGKVIVIVSDGEAHDDNAVIGKVEELYRNKGIITFSVGVGTDKGSYIPMSGGIKKLNKNGDVINTRLEKDYLSKIAKAGGGEFVVKNSFNDSLEPIFDKINRLKKGEFDTISMNFLKERFQYFLAFLIVLFSIYLFIPGKKLSFGNSLRIKDK